MFCFRCGAQIQDDADFCYKCGSAVARPAQQPAYQAPQQPAYQPAYQAPQQPAYQPAYQAPQQPVYQPAPPQPAAYGAAPIKCGVNVVYPDGHDEIGDLYISPAELVFVRKSKAVRIAFGFLGSSIENGQEALRIPVADIVYGQRTRIGLNVNVYQITMRSGENFKICFNQPSKIACLENLIHNR